MPGESGCDTPLSEFNFPELPDYPSPVKLTEGIRRWEESDEEFSVPVVPTAGAILSEASEQGINVFQCVSLNRFNNPYSRIVVTVLFHLFVIL